MGVERGHTRSETGVLRADRRCACENVVGEGPGYSYTAAPLRNTDHDATTSDKDGDYDPVCAYSHFHSDSSDGYIYVDADAYADIDPHRADTNTYRNAGASDSYTHGDASATDAYDDLDSPRADANTYDNAGTTNSHTYADSAHCYVNTSTTDAYADGHGSASDSYSHGTSTHSHDHTSTADAYANWNTRHADGDVDSSAHSDCADTGGGEWPVGGSSGCYLFSFGRDTQ